MKVLRHCVACYRRPPLLDALFGDGVLTRLVVLMAPEVQKIAKCNGSIVVSFGIPLLSGRERRGAHSSTAVVDKQLIFLRVVGQFVLVSPELLPYHYCYYQLTEG